MTTSTTPSALRERILSPAYAATTVAMFGLIAFVAFEAMAVAFNRRLDELIEG